MTDTNQMAVEYMHAVAMALDEVSLRHGPRGDMEAALAALCACQADLIATLKEGRTRKQMRDKCARHLLEYTTRIIGDDKRGVSKRTIEVLPPEVH